MKNPMLIKIKGLRRRRYKRYPMLMELTNAEQRHLLEVIKKMPNDIKRRKNEPWY